MLALSICWQYAGVRPKMDNNQVLLVKSVHSVAITAMHYLIYKRMIYQKRINRMTIQIRIWNDYKNLTKTDINNEWTLVQITRKTFQVAPATAHTIVTAHANFSITKRAKSIHQCKNLISQESPPPNILTNKVIGSFYWRGATFVLTLCLFCKGLFGG